MCACEPGFTCSRCQPYARWWRDAEEPCDGDVTAERDRVAHPADEAQLEDRR